MLLAFVTRVDRSMAKPPPKYLQDFDRNPEHALKAYLYYNRSWHPGDRRNYCPELIRLAVQLGYVSWPRKIHRYVLGKRVLDIGCGRTLHGVGFLVAGARRYVGCDPKIWMDSDTLRDRSPGTANSKERKSFGWTPRQIMERVPRISYYPALSTEAGLTEKFDVVLLHNVTEHAPDLPALFDSAASHLAAGGRVIFNHHNFYCWNGHHLRPRTVDGIDMNDPLHRKAVDWGHIDLAKAGDPMVGDDRLNRVRLDDLRRMTEVLFEIERWEEQPSNEQQGAGRLTPAIMARHPELRERDFTVQNVFCVARLRSAARS
jgi:SAM-dependent methyltransferase